MSTTLTFTGDLDRALVAEIAEQIDRVPAEAGPLTIELGDTEMNDGAACARLATAIRQAAQRVGDVVVVEAPQVLAHTLYRVGALGDGRSGAVQLVEPREELGTAG